MPTCPPMHRPLGYRTRQDRNRDHDRRRSTSQAWRAWYKTARWKKARIHFLAQPENCLCVMCKAAGLLNDGSLRMSGAPQPNPKRRYLVVDHIIPHRGNEGLFWDSTNWQTLCPDHHDILKQRQEARGGMQGRGSHGQPNDLKHPWGES